jgi:hypothetical protein
MQTGTPPVYTDSLNDCSDDVFDSLNIDLNPELEQRTRRTLDRLISF